MKEMLGLLPLLCASGNQNTLKDTKTIANEEKIYVDEDVAEFLENAGCKIETEFEDGQNLYFVTENSLSTSTNVFATLAAIVSEIEHGAIIENFTTPNLTVSGAIHENNNIVLGYIRSFNENYVTDFSDFSISEFTQGMAWSMMSGVVDPIYTHAQDYGSYNNVYFNEYFGKRLSSYDNYSLTYHNSISYYYVPFTDPISNHQIDLIHMFASLDGCYQFTDNSLLINNCLTNDEFSNLSSWAGDLQQCADAYGTSTIATPNSTGLNILLSSMGAGEEDLISDIDAFNLGSSYLTMYTTLSSGISNYYSDVYSMEMRCSRFIKNVTDSTYISRAAFENVVYGYMGLSRYGNDWNDKTDYSPDYINIVCWGMHLQKTEKKLQKSL